MWVGSNICFGFIVCSPQHKGCWSFRKCQEGVKVLDDFKWKRCEKDDPVQAEPTLLRLAEWCWLIGTVGLKDLRNNPWKIPSKTHGKIYQGTKKHGINAGHAFYHLLTVQRAFFGRGVQFNQPAFDQKTLKVWSWILPRGNFCGAENTPDERWWTDAVWKHDLPYLKGRKNDMIYLWC